MEQIISTLPTPNEVIFNPISYMVFTIFGGLMLWEALFPARELPKIKFWKMKGIMAFIIFFFLSSYLPILWDGTLSEYQIMDLTGLGTMLGAIVGVILYEFVLYVWHRSLHKSDFLWKGVHQLHHSAERVDTFGAFYFSPLDMIGGTVVNSFCLVLVAGFTPEATTLIILVTTFLVIFQHSNIKTPTWIGYIAQRPEAHTVHHAKGIHAFNYAGLTWFDIIFGTFKNPKKHEYETGFYPGASKKIKDMLLFRNISDDKK